MHEVEPQKKLVPGLGHERLPEGWTNRVIRITAHQDVLAWTKTLSAREIGAILYSAYQASKQQ